MSMREKEKMGGRKQKQGERNAFTAMQHCHLGYSYYWGSINMVKHFIIMTGAIKSSNTEHHHF